MVKKIGIVILLLFSVQAGFGQQPVKSVIRELKTLDGGERISAENICLDITDRGNKLKVRIKSVEVLEFRESNYPLFAERFQNTVENLKDNRYQSLTGNSRQSVLMRVKNNFLRELVVFRTGSRFGVIYVKGKVDIREFWDEFAPKLDIYPEEAPQRSERPERPDTQGRPERHKRSKQ